MHEMGIYLYMHEMGIYLYTNKVVLLVSKLRLSFYGVEFEALDMF